MQLILHGGNARGAAYEALDEAEEYNFEKAEELLEEAHEEFVQAHKYQTQVVQNQEEGVVPNFFMIHAQDRSEEHTSELQSRFDLVCRLLLEKKNIIHADM